MLKAILFWGFILLIVGGFLYSILEMVLVTLKDCILGIVGYLDKYSSKIFGHFDTNKTTNKQQNSDQQIELYIQQNKDSLIITSFKQHIIEMVNQLNNNQHSLEYLQDELKEFKQLLIDYYQMANTKTQIPYRINKLLSSAILAKSKNTMLIFLYEILEEINKREF